MRKCYHVFLLVFALTFITPILDLPYYVYNVDVTFLAKIPLVTLFLCAAVFHIKYKLQFTFESVLFALWGILALLLGLAVNDPGSEFFSHAYAAFMPVVTISFAQYFARDFSRHLRSVLAHMLSALYYVILGMLVAYVYLYHVAGVWSYYGFGTGMAFVAIYMLSTGMHGRFIVGLILDVLSGKRAGVLVASAVAVIYFRGELPRMTPSRVIGLAALIVLGSYGFLYADGLDFFRRFRLLFEFDAEDSLAIFYATGGRLTEVFSIFDYMAEEPARWVFGSGMGAQYVFDDPRQGFELETFHYAHFSPMGYVFLFGIPFAALLYSSLFARVIRGLRYSGNFFYLAFLVLFFGSFFGATSFVDPRGWFFLGIVIFLLKNGEGPGEKSRAKQPVALRI